MTDTELRSLSDTNLNAHGGPRAPRDPLLEKDKRLEKVRHLLLCRGSTGCRSWRKSGRFASDCDHDIRYQWQHHDGFCATGIG